MDKLTIEATARLAASTLIVHDKSVDFESGVFCLELFSGCNESRVEDQEVNDCTNRGGTYQERKLWYVR